jgi:hypothetical protein
VGITASGKSTFAKQLRVIHGISFTEMELDNIKTIIRSNIINGLHEVIQLVNKNNLELQEVNIKYARYLDTLTKETNCNEIWKETGFIQKLQSLWLDPSVRISSESPTATLWNLSYFMNKIELIATDTYIPNNDDIFRFRQRTSGAAITEFTAAKQVWNFKDAGGQASERKLWPEIIATGLHAIIFFVALDEYDSPSDINPMKTKMEDSLEAWCDLFKLPSVKTSCVLLFLNKIDLFTDKWKKDSTSFKKIFNKQQSVINVNDAISVIGDYYISNIPEEFQVPGKIYVAPVNSLDTGLITAVFNQVKVHVVKNLQSKK